MTDEVPDREALATVIWGARRTGLPVAVAMRGKGRAQMVADALAAAGVTAHVASGGGGWTSASVSYDVAAK